MNAPKNKEEQIKFDLSRKELHWSLDQVLQLPLLVVLVLTTCRVKFSIPIVCKLMGKYKEKTNKQKTAQHTYALKDFRTN